MTELTVSVAGSVITVTMPGTDYSITYQKVADAQRLVPIKNWLTEDFFVVRHLDVSRPLVRRRRIEGEGAWLAHVADRELRGLTRPIG